MKKANKKLASAIVLGLMLAVPVGVSAAGELHEGINKTDGSNTVVGDFGTNIKFGKDIHANNTEAIYLKGNSSETKTSLTVNGDVVEFTGTTESGTFDGTGNFAAWQDGNSELTINANELIIGSAEMGSDRGFQMKGEGNTLNINTDKIVAYVGDGFINAQGVANTTNTSVVNIGTAQDRIGLFEAHTTYGKDDYGVAILQANEGNTVNLYADKAILDGSEYEVGGVIGTGSYGTVNVDVTDLTIDGNICGTYGKVTYVDKVAELNVKADTLKMDGDINVGSMEDGYSNFNRDTIVNVTVANNANITGDINVYGNDKDGKGDDSTANLNFAGTATIIGDINVEGALGNVSIKATTDNAKVDIVGDVSAKNGSSAYIDLGNGGSFTGSVTDGTVKSAGEAATFAANRTPAAGVTLDFGSGSVWNVTGESTVNTITGEGTISTDDLNNKVIVNDAADASLTVNGSGNIADAIYQDSAKAQELANVVVTSGGTTAADKVTTDEGVIAGRYEFDVTEEGKVDTANGSYTKNTKNEAVSNMASIGLMSWRAQNNDMNKRLGELRNSNGEHGVWTRMVRGESEYGAQNVKNQYNIYQLGYDEKLSTDKDWTVGAAITYSEGKSSFEAGSGEDKSTGFAVYGSYLGDNGEFVDLIAKYARLDNEFDVTGGVGSGDYSTNGYSFSAEYGKRTELANDFYFEPQVELTYGRVADVEFITDSGAKVSQDAMDSLVGRVGFAAGKNIKNGNVYVRASYLYDFDGETNVTFSKDRASESFSEDLGGGWFEFGIGTNINLSDATYLYLDVEKTTGGEVDTNWQWNAGVRYSF